VKKSIQEFIENVKINTADDRGFYITDWNSNGNGGVWYLYADGVLRIGTFSLESSAFWITREDATEFFNKWKLANSI